MKNFEINIDVQRLLREIGTMGSYNGFNHVIKDLIKYVYTCSIGELSLRIEELSQRVEELEKKYNETNR